MINNYGNMTQEYVTQSFIYHKWYYGDSVAGYHLINDYTNMLMFGYGELFKYDNGKSCISTYQSIPFYCINKNGYLKLCRIDAKHIPDWSINDMMKDIKELCIKNGLTFVSLFSNYYNYLWVKEFLGEDLKYEYDKEGDIILYV